MKPVASDWDRIALLLKIPAAQRRNIQRDKNHSCESCLGEMLDIWVQQTSPPPSWKDLAEALDTEEHTKLAKAVRDKYISSNSTN